MMKKIITALFLLLSFNVAAEQSGSSGRHELYGEDYSPGVILIEDAIEADSLRISLNENLTGFVEGKICDDCETIKVKITPKTKAYENNVEVPLKRAESRLGRSATVYFLIKTNEVSRISW